MNQMTLTNEPNFPDQYRETISTAIQRIYSARKWEMEQQFGFYDMPPVISPLQMILADPLALIARAAVGELAHSEETDGELVECIQTVMEVLFSNPLLNFYQIPNEFWKIDIGAMIARAQLWLHNDLITMVECAEKFGVTVQAVSQAIDAGRLRGYADPDASQRQGSRKISLGEATELWGK